MYASDQQSWKEKSSLLTSKALKKYDYKNRFVADILENIEAYRKKRKKCNSTSHDI